MLESYKGKTKLMKTKTSGKINFYSVTDPGFPRDGGANPPRGRQHKILPNFPKTA